MDADPQASSPAWSSARTSNQRSAWQTLGEIRRGILEKPNGKRRAALDVWFSGPEGLQALFAGPILPFGRERGPYLDGIDGGRTRRRPRSGLDIIIAAVADANDCIVVTDNEKDFAGVQVINPIRGSM
ncbi:putative nucleic acid-binding protein [Bradyrhizobium sp. USDA 3315]